MDGVRELATHGDIQVVTHRPQRAVRDTLAFLAYADFPIVGVTVTQGPKSEVGCDVYIDDAPHVIEELESAGKEVVVFDRPYNRGLWLPDATRAFTWDDVPRLVGEVLS